MPLGLPKKYQDETPTKDCFGNTCWLPLTIDEQRQALAVLADFARLPHGAKARAFINKRRQRLRKYGD